MSGTTISWWVLPTLVFRIATTSGFCAWTPSTESPAAMAKRVSPAIKAAIEVGAPEMSDRSTSSPCCCHSPASCATQKGPSAPLMMEKLARTAVAGATTATGALPPADGTVAAGAATAEVAAGAARGTSAPRPVHAAPSANPSSTAATPARIGLPSRDVSAMVQQPGALDLASAAACRALTRRFDDTLHPAGQGSG